jgi:hypothetical protein
MSSWEVFSQEVACPGCGAQYTYLVEAPPIAMVVRRFVNDEGREVGEDCPRCWEPLPVPEEAL